MTEPSSGAPGQPRRIGILTGGGDAPGLNAVIRAVVKAATNCRCQCIGLEDSFDGLLDPTRSRVLTPKDVTGILRIGGTVLGTSNRGNPFEYPSDDTGTSADYSGRCIETFHRLGLDALVVIGGDGTLAIAHEFAKRGLPVVGVPKTIDNDIVETVNTFGFYTAVEFATGAIDRLHTTAHAHHRVMVVEVMGRNAGWIALYSGVAGGADAILIPEIPFDIDRVADRVLERERWGARFSLVVAAEGAIPVAGELSMLKGDERPGNPRLGGIGKKVAIQLEPLVKKETRHVVLGHLQRGGAPNAYDRMLATRFGAAAMRLINTNDFGKMVAFKPPDILSVPLESVVGRTKNVPLDSDILMTARALGISLGD